MPIRKKYFLNFLLCLCVLFAISILAATNTGANFSQQLINLNFRNITVRDALQLLAQFKGVNIIMSDSVKGELTLNLQDVTWQQALTTILTMQGLAERQQSNVLFIAPIAEFTARDQQSQDLQPLKTSVIPLRYAQANLIAELLQSKSSDLLSARGAVIVDSRTNSLIIKDTARKVLEVKKLLSQLDLPAKQVAIIARVVNVDHDFVRDLGLKFGTEQATTTNATENLTMDMPNANFQTGNFNLAIAKLGNNNLLDLELSALESEGHAVIISNPKLITANRQTALIQSGQDIPYQEKTSSGATNVAFKKAVLSLKVTPEITSDNKISLNLIVNQDKVSPILINGVPAINTQEVQTQVLVNNGETLVLGGVYEQVNRNYIERVPFLGSIPWVGGLFRNKQTKLERKELLIFVTPKIL